MNYKEYLNNTEGKDYSDSIKLEKDMLDDFFNFIKNNYNEKDYNKLKNWFTNVHFPIMLLSTFSDNIQDYIIKNIISKYNKRALLYGFMQKIICNYIYNNTNLVNVIMESLKIIGLVKDIKFNNNNSIFPFCITLEDGTNLNFSNIRYDEEGIDYDKNEADAHGMCQKYLSAKIQEDIDLSNIYILCVKIDCLVDRKVYHTVIVNNGLVYDLGRNILMSYKNFIKVFNPDIIIYEDGYTALEHIKEYSVKYDWYNVYPILRYTIDKEVGSRK